MSPVNGLSIPQVNRRKKCHDMCNQGHVKVAAVRTVGALNFGKSEMARPALPVPFFCVGAQDVTRHAAVSEKC